MHETGSDQTGPRQVTGRMVLVTLIAFFAVIIGVNAFMAHEALSTFRGVEADSAYKAGQQFEQDVAAAKAQEAEHWQVDAKVTPAADGAVLLDVTARDASGEPLSSLTATALFARPTDRHLDRSMPVTADAPGHFHGAAVVTAGQWDLILEFSREGDRLFRSKNRVIIK
jgi:nitrogen fixation protein FixH